MRGDRERSPGNLASFRSLLIVLVHFPAILRIATRGKKLVNGALQIPAALFQL